MSDNSIDVKYINSLSHRVQGFHKVRQNLWNGRCNICGDSKKNQSKRRLYVYLKDGHFSVKCHNCQYAQPFATYLKEYFHSDYIQYMIEKLPSKSTSRFSTKKTKDPSKLGQTTKKCTGFDYSSLMVFDSLPNEHPARQYIENRQIPLNMVFYAPRFSDFIKEIGIQHYILSYSHAHEPRMIIPFYRRDGLSTVFQARAFSHKESLRYITIKEMDSESKVYGLDRVDKDKTVYCTEGPLDSLMIPNCISMSGISLRLPQGIDDLVFVFDNEPRNSDVVNNMRKRLLKGSRVVIFPRSLQYKDLNDMIVKGGYTQDKLIKLIQDNTYGRNIGLVKLKEWCR